LDYARVLSLEGVWQSVFEHDYEVGPIIASASVPLDIRNVVHVLENELEQPLKVEIGMSILHLLRNTLKVCFYLLTQQFGNQHWSSQLRLPLPIEVLNKVLKFVNGVDTPKALLKFEAST
jgi:hypothetical protein